MKRLAICLAGLLLGNLLAVPCISEIAGRDPRTSSQESRTNDDREAVSEYMKRQWALGCAAVLTERNYDNHTLLGGCHPNANTAIDKKRLLSDAWGVENREDLIETLEGLDRRGHRSTFEMVACLVAPLTEEGYRDLLKGTSDPELLNRFRVARRYYSQLGPKSLCGWDYSRAICLCRWAYIAGHIEEEEAWERIMPMAIRLQEKFDSWEDLGRNYLIGRQFWSLEKTQENGWRYEDAFQRLLDMQSSPWNKYPWELRLKDEANEGSRDGPQPKEEPQHRIEDLGPLAAL